MANPTPASFFPQTQTHSEIEEIEMENQRPSPPTAIDSFSASASSTAVDYGYDVFINHRGPDTKKKLASPLYRSLLSRGFKTFLDQEELEVGLNFSIQLVGAIRSASVHVAIFSPRYAESKWCLDELHLMQETGARIIPIFYGVKPGDLRWTDQNNNGVYARALQELERKTTYNSQTHQDEPRYDSATLLKWRNALSSVSNLHGFDFEEGPFNRDEDELLDKVVECVGKIMAKKTQLFVAKNPTGLDDKVKDLETTITVSRQQHRGKAQVLGILGPGGVGKTTLAKEFFNRKRSEYKNYYFLSDVRDNAKSSLHSLQIKLLKGLNQNVERIDDIHSGTEKVQKFLSSYEVLLILDDIDNTNQVDALLPDRDALCSNSLILITSRDKDVLASAQVEEESIYKLKGLSTQHSLQLFCSYAFCQPFPQSGFENLVDKYLKACHGLPLSLKVFGALLWQKGESFWEERLHQLQVPNEIQERLKISYDALHEKEQQMFLDIACIFIGESRDITIGIWDEPGWKGSLGFRNLECRCLVEVDSDNCIHMHDHLRDLGREIARRRNLWHQTENIDDLLQPSSVITELRGIRIFPKYPETLSWYQRKIQRYRSPSVGAMELQLLTIGGYLLERILRRVQTPNLTWLSWRNCPYSYMPSWIPMKNLRVLKVEGEVFKTLWQGRSKAPFQLRALEISGRLLDIPKSIGQLEQLERIFFSHVSFQKLPEEFCNLRALKVLVIHGPKLKALPHFFGNLTNLQHMALSCSESFERLPESFGNLTNLQHMALSGCKSLERLPESFGNLTNLQHMELYECWSLERLPETFGNLTNLQHMALSWCKSLERLPESFGNLMTLQHMALSWCESLERLPESFGNLTNLQHMALSWCKSLERLPESLGKLTNLQHMELSGCGSLGRLPESLGKLTNLKHMALSGYESLEKLPESFGKLTNLQHMALSGCKSLERLPKSFGDLTNLQHMELSFFVILKRLPVYLGNLTNLQHMALSRCDSLEKLPESLGKLTNLQHMKLSSCRSLWRLPESLGNLTNLQRMELYWCTSLERLPESFGKLTNLQHMALSGCGSLERLPESFGKLTNLQHMELSECSCLWRLPESFGNLTNLQRMKLYKCRSLVSLPESFGNLMTLQRMALSWCDSLGRLPESFGNLRNLQRMKLSYCGCLQRLPESFGSLRNLQRMKLSYCGCLQRLPESFGKLTSLQHMEVSYCGSLERLPESFGNLANLQHMEVSNCGSLERLPESFGNLTNLQDMALSWCESFGRLPESLGNLTNLQNMKLYFCGSLESLPESFGNLTNLRYMELTGCESLARLPESLGNLTKLQHIRLYGCKSLETLPSIKTLVSLEELGVSYCEKLKSITALSQLTKLRFLNVAGCLELAELDSVESCISLVTLLANGCPKLKFGNGVVNKLRQQNTTIYRR